MPPPWRGGEEGLAAAMAVPEGAGAGEGAGAEAAPAEGVGQLGGRQGPPAGRPVPPPAVGAGGP